MRWPWTRRRPVPPPAADDVADAVEARQHAEAALERDRARTAEVRRVTSAAREHRAVNHFAQLIAETFRG